MVMVSTASTVPENTLEMRRKEYPAPVSSGRAARNSAEKEGLSVSRSRLSSEGIRSVQGVLTWSRQRNIARIAARFPSFPQ